MGSTFHVQQVIIWRSEDAFRVRSSFHRIMDVPSLTAARTSRVREPLLITIRFCRTAFIRF